MEKYYHNENILSPLSFDRQKSSKPRKNVRWNYITDYRETYSKDDYDRRIDSQQIAQNLNESRIRKQQERQRNIIYNRSMMFFFEPFKI